MDETRGTSLELETSQIEKKKLFHFHKEMRNKLKNNKIYPDKKLIENQVKLNGRIHLFQFNTRFRSILEFLVNVILKVQCSARFNSPISHTRIINLVKRRTFFFAQILCKWEGRDILL